MGGTPVYVRAHHMFTSGDGSPALKWGSTGIYREDEQGKPVYDFTIADRIVDTWVGLGLKPLMQLGFMPEALSTKPEGYPKKPQPADIFWAGGAFSYPPKDYQKWGDLCYAWTKHCVERHGRVEAASWRWQVWNEPNIGYWMGTPEEFFKLYDFATDGIRRALPEASSAVRTQREDFPRPLRSRSSSTACAAPTTPPAAWDRHWISSPSMLRARRVQPTTMSAWASRPTSPTSTHACALLARYPNSRASRSSSAKATPTAAPHRQAESPDPPPAIHGTRLPTSPHRDHLAHRA